MKFYNKSYLYESKSPLRKISLKDAQIIAHTQRLSNRYRVLFTRWYEDNEDGEIKADFCVFSPAKSEIRFITEMTPEIVPKRVIEYYPKAIADLDYIITSFYKIEYPQDYTLLNIWS